jgi:hypothetical protein
VVLPLAALVGCATPGGGRLVKRDYKPNVLVSYQSEGDVPPGVRYYLVREGAGLAMFEQSEDGTGVVFERHWVDHHGDHFAVWAGSAFEVVVPRDRAQPAYRFEYPPTLYKVENHGGVERPVPAMPIEANAKLHPAGAVLRAPVAPPPPASPSSSPGSPFHK